MSKALALGITILFVVILLVFAVPLILINNSNSLHNDVNVTGSEAGAYNIFLSNSDLFSTIMASLSGPLGLAILAIVAVLFVLGIVAVAKRTT